MRASQALLVLRARTADLMSRLIDAAEATAADEKTATSGCREGATGIDERRRSSLAATHSRHAGKADAEKDDRSRLWHRGSASGNAHAQVVHCP